MELVELTLPPSEALPLAAFKAHLQLGSGFSDENLQDELLEAFLRAAMATIEARIGKALLTRELEWHITAWTEAERQPLPIAPVSGVAGIVLVAADGGLTTVPLEDFSLLRDTHRPQVLATQAALPRIPANGAVAIRFFAGFGESWTDVPADLRQATLLLATHYYENRHEISGPDVALPFGVMSLLEPHRNIRLFGARA